MFGHDNADVISTRNRQMLASARSAAYSARMGAEAARREAEDAATKVAGVVVQSPRQPHGIDPPSSRYPSVTQRARTNQYSFPKAQATTKRAAVANRARPHEASARSHELSAQSSERAAMQADPFALSGLRGRPGRIPARLSGQTVLDVQRAAGSYRQAAQEWKAARREWSAATWIRQSAV